MTQALEPDTLQIRPVSHRSHVGVEAIAGQFIGLEIQTRPVTLNQGMIDSGSSGSSRTPPAMGSGTGNALGNEACAETESRSFSILRVHASSKDW